MQHIVGRPPHGDDYASVPFPLILILIGQQLEIASVMRQQNQSARGRVFKLLQISCCDVGALLRSVRSEATRSKERGKQDVDILVKVESGKKSGSCGMTSRSQQ